MKLQAWMLLLLLVVADVYGQDTGKDIQDASSKAIFKKAGELYSQGKYASAADELRVVESRLTPAESSPSVLGLISYWKGICEARNQDFPQAIESFKRSLGLRYVPQDLPYEYGQVLFAAEKLPEARVQFRESLKRKFKPAVSLYYIGYISKELGEKKKAFTFLRAIEKLQGKEALEVKQPAEMMIADLYLEQVEKHPDAFRAVENYVIPQYERALELNPDSALSSTIKDKILDLQRRYDLVLFQLRNGRPTLRPPYFLRLAAELGSDSNVTFTPTQTTVAKSEQSSLFGKTSAMGRYTVYHEDFFSVAPELTFIYTRYLNRVPSIYRNDNAYISPALRTAYEHTLGKKPASFLADYEFSELRRDVNARQRLDFNSRSHAFMVGERFNYFLRGESVARLKYRTSDSYIDSSDSTTTTFIFEQMWGLQTSTLLFYFSYDRTRMTDPIYDTNNLTLRTDLIMGKVRDWFSPSVGLSLTKTDPINNADRGKELLVNPNFRLSHSFSKNWRSSFKFDYQDYRSKDEENFAYKKSLYGLELEYLF